MKLLIVESPGKIEKLTDILGQGWTVAASYGHVRDLPEREIGVEAPTFEPQYRVLDKSKHVIARLKKLVGEADEVFLATDPDREGEAIAWHLQELLKLPRALRCTFGDINPEPVRAAVAHPRGIDLNLVRAQEARRILDRFVGYLVSPVLSRQAGEKLTAGRVQSPAVRLVVERERAIKSFKPTRHFSAEFFFDGPAGRWSAEWDTKTVFPDEPHYCLNQATAEAVMKLRAFNVLDFKDSTRKRAPAPPFTTSTLQQAASSKLKLNPAKAMEIAQALYEKGVITYHRTDSPNLSADGFKHLTTYAAGAGIAVVPKQRTYKAKQGAQEGHEAIRCSHFEDTDAGTSDDEKALYKLIRLRAIASQMPEAEYAVRSATLTAPLGSKTVHLVAKGETLTAPGWTQIYDEDDEDDDKSGAGNPIPHLISGQAATANDAALLKKQTKAPARYTQASLVKELDAQGIGRPSTYAAIMDRIVNVGYVLIEKNLLHATKLAEQLIDSLVGTAAFVDIDFTRAMEAELDEIAGGQAKYLGLVSRSHTQLLGEIGKIRVAGVTIHDCPTCGNPLGRRHHEGRHYWSCSAYPACKTTLPDADGVPGKAKAPATLSQHLCPACSKPLVHRVKTGKGAFDFWGCSGFPACKASYKDNQGVPILESKTGTGK